MMSIILQVFALARFWLRIWCWLEVRSEDLISYRSLAQHFDFTGALIKWAHSWLRNYFMSAPVGSKGKSKLGSY
ncbi:MAG: hypothetical protein V3U88_01410, partial [Methylococcales bacterium]